MPKTIRNRILILAAASLVMLMGCQTLSTMMATPTPLPTSTPYPTFTPLPTNTPFPTDTPVPPTEPPDPPPPPSGEIGELLFFDDFSDSSTGWDQLDDDNKFIDYEEGGYRILVRKESLLAWGNPNLYFTDVRIEVDAEMIGGGEDNNFGIICRYENSDNFYALVISTDGFYAIRKRIDGGSLEVISEDGYFGESDAIVKHGPVNQIAAECFGDYLRLYVNGELVAEVIDGDISAGDVGLIAGTFEPTTTDILFDNFTLYEMEP